MGLCEYELSRGTCSHRQTRVEGRKWGIEDVHDASWTGYVHVRSRRSPNHSTQIAINKRHPHTTALLAQGSSWYGPKKPPQWFMAIQHAHCSVTLAGHELVPVSSLL